MSRIEGAAKRTALMLVPVALLIAPCELRAQEAWPREVPTERATVLMYQPQLEDFQGNELTGRAALSVQRDDGDAPVFGAVWLSARVETDTDERTVEILEISVSRVRFPNATPAQEDSLTQLLERELPQWETTMSLDRLLVSLQEIEDRRAIAMDLNNEPPAIVFVDYPAILVMIDGEPIMQEIENSDHERIVNTPYTLIRASDTGTYYLYAGEDQWYSARGLRDEWTLRGNVPESIAVLTPPPPEEEEIPEEIEEEEEGVDEGPPPAIIVATEPTELIVTEGAPELAPLEGTELLYVTNTEDDILLEIDSQRYFLVLTGRWFASTSLDGPWAFVEPDELPGSFSEIPPESELGHLRASIPGTEESQEALLEQYIPQTATVDREATLDVEYDGDPEFEPIEETALEYAINTAASVIKIDDQFYACDNAVWFVADDPEGPWIVADSVPQEVYSIPPSSPVHNVTYVYVYESTPEVVYVGYYPGYAGTYVYNGVIVYGTGYWYHPWYRHYYYPRPVTWGFHVRWNPWYGWSFGFSYSRGPFHFHLGFGSPWYRGGWWGPVGYRGYRYGYHRGWHHGYRAGARAGYRAGYRAGTRNAQRNNIYNRPQNRTRNVARTQPARPQTRPAQPQARPSTQPNRPNNVYSDRNGNTLRRNDNGSWDQRGSSGWQPSTTPNNSLDRSANSRQRGTTRSNNFNQSRAGSSGARAGTRRR